MSILLSLQAVGSQAADQMPDLTAVTLPTEAEINVIDLAFKGGWIMVVLLLLSLMAIYIFVQRLIIIRRAGKEDETFMNRIKDYIHEGKVDSALNLCRSTNTPSARMIEKGITRLGRPMNDVLVAIENVGNLEIAKLEKRFSLDRYDRRRRSHAWFPWDGNRYGTCLLRYGKRRHQCGCLPIIRRYL